MEKAGFKPGVDFMYAMDPASTEFYNAETGMYELKGEGVEYTSAQMVDYWEKLVDTYPIISIEDGMAEEDWDGWKALTDRIGDKVQLVGFGTFETAKRAAREGRNPQTGKTVKIAASVAPKFKAGKALKDIVNK